MEKYKSLILFILRLVIGWHFLYEGLIKLFTGDWSSSGYLESSYGFLSGFYHSLAGNPSILKIVDFLNIWGLILIGAGLFLGILIRLSSVSGIFLLVLYYFAYPPFGSYNLIMNQEGHFWIINRNFLEAVALGIVFLYPVTEFSIINLANLFRKKISDELGKDQFSQNRRHLLKGLASLPFFGGLVYAASSATSKGIDAMSGATKTVQSKQLKDLKGKVPAGKLGNLEVSRIIAGCNQIMGYSHARDLSYVDDLILKYNTESKLFETFALYDAVGINTTNMVVDAYPVFNKYKKVTGSKMQSICQVHFTPKDLFTEINQAIDYGATSMYIQGARGDMLVHPNRLDLIAKVVEYIRSKGMLAGIGSHSIQVPIACEKTGISPDYYYKTMHHDKYWSATPVENREEFSLRENDPSDPKTKSPNNKLHDNMFDLYPDQTIEVFSRINIPLIGFKVLAGGAIPPRQGFRYAFEGGADFICVGMFDWQVVENTNLIIDLFSSDIDRKRPWYS